MTQVLRLLIALLVLGSTAHAGTFSRNFHSGPKIDILFVIDNSGSMQGAQRDLTANLPRFIEKLNASTIDFHVGVTTTDAYRSLFRPEDAGLARLRDGFEGTHTGVFVVTRDTPAVSDVLATNLNQGIRGYGDERAFSSLRAALEHPANAEFRRPDAALSVVVVSDEDDFSRLLPTATTSYDDPKLIAVNEFAQVLESLGGRHATFSAIAAFDTDCVQADPSAFRRIGRRYQELTALTGGYQGSLCELPAAFEQYADFAIEQAVPPARDYVIRLDHNPIVDTIVVKVNGRLVKADEHEGWTYDPASNSLILHGRSVPQKGDFVSVTYDYQEP